MGSIKDDRPTATGYHRSSRLSVIIGVLLTYSAIFGVFFLWGKFHFLSMFIFVCSVDSCYLLCLGFIIYHAVKAKSSKDTDLLTGARILEVALIGLISVMLLPVALLSENSHPIITATLLLLAASSLGYLIATVISSEP